MAASVTAHGLIVAVRLGSKINKFQCGEERWHLCKALCTREEEPRRTFAELAEQWRALAERAEYLERYHSPGY